MGLILRDFDAQSKFCREFTVEAIGKAVPMQVVDAIIEQEGVREERQRKLNTRLVVMLCIAMNLWVQSSLTEVLENLAQGLRLVFPDWEFLLPGKGAIVYRRKQLGAQPMVALFHAVCRPMATPETVGAFLFGLRTMAVDGTIEDVPDTPENDAAFGRLGSQRGASAFPQVRGVYLVETGTHAIVDAGFWPCHTSERIGGGRVMRSLGPGMLAMWDRGFHSYDMLERARAQGAHVLSRLPKHVKLEHIRDLPDGSSLANLWPDKQRYVWKKKAKSKQAQRRKRAARKQRKERKPIRVRMVEYTLTDPRVSGHGERHRLITTLLDHTVAPAPQLVCSYHERWECETVIDEVDTHQRLAGRPLRSRTPTGVIQELYGLLIAHYAVRFHMHEAALRKGIDPDRISFTRTLQVIRRAVCEFQLVHADLLPGLYERMLRDIARRPLTERKPRSNPRVVKRKMSKYNLKRSHNWPGYHKLPDFESLVLLI